MRKLFVKNSSKSLLKYRKSLVKRSQIVNKASVTKTTHQKTSNEVKISYTKVDNSSASQKVHAVIGVGMESINCWYLQASQSQFRIYPNPKRYPLLSPNVNTVTLEDVNIKVALVSFH